METSKNISILEHELCCGCKACADSCSKNFIHFSIDNEGFYYPNIDESNCINCGKCVRVCPELNVSKDTCSSSVAIAGYAIDDQRHRMGSSGGYFGLLAEYVINKGGVVYGAAFDENLQVIHKRVSSKEDLPLLYKSKYIQSNTIGIYKDIRVDLANNKMVLFCGTPCQCNAVRNYIGKIPDNLLLVDFICHGVPSQALFNDNIKWLEKKLKAKITKFTFRYKNEDTTNPRSYGIEYCRKGKYFFKQGLYHDIPFYYGFQQYLFLRPSCYLCKWSSVDRVSDITLGDFWGIHKVDPEFDESKGVSLLLINTHRGEAVAKYINNFGPFRMKEFPIQIAVNNNAALRASTKLASKRNLFFKDYLSFGFDYVVKKYLTPKYSFLWRHYYDLPRSIRKLLNHLK